MLEKSIFRRFGACWAGISATAPNMEMDTVFDGWEAVRQGRGRVGGGKQLRNLGNSLRNVTSGRGRFLGDWNSGTLNLWVWSDGTRSAREPQEWLIVQKRSMGMLCKSVSSIRLRSGTGRSCLRPQTKRPNLQKESYRIAVGGSGNT